MMKFNVTLANPHLEVEGEWEPGTAAFTSGLPEDCYPGEPDEIEITTVKTKSGDDITDLLEVDALHEKLVEQVIEALTSGEC